MTGDRLPIAGKIKRVRLVKFDNDPVTGEPIRDNPREIWEGENESNMKCIFQREDLKNGID